MRILPAILCGLMASGAVRAAEIAPGVVVEAQGAAVFLTSPARRIEARAIATGSLRWSSTEAVRPLAVHAGRLLAQSDGPAGRLDLVILDAASGRRVAAESMPLPEGVSAPIDEVLGTRFELRVEQAGPQVRLDWSWEQRPVRGALLEDEEEQVRRATGAVTVDLAAARFAAATPRPPAEGPIPLPPALAAAADAGAFRQRPQRMGALLVATQESQDGALLLKRWTDAGVPLPDTPLPPGVTLQMASADGAHALVSAPATEGAHTWTILRLDSGLIVATFRSATAAAPFAVAAGRVLAVHQPREYRTAAGRQDDPRRIEAIDAVSGTVAWSQPVRDFAYRGPVAP